MTFVPTPIEDETLESIITRWRWRSREIPEKDFFLRAFGRSNVDLESVTACGGERLHSTSGVLMEAETVASKHTLRSFVRLFVPRKVVAGAAAGKTMRALRRFRNLRHCPACTNLHYEADHGVTGTLRAHCLPGVTACLHHGVRLLPGGGIEEVIADVDQGGYYARSYERMRPPYPGRELEQQASAEELNFAREMVALLQEETNLDCWQLWSALDWCLRDSFGVRGRHVDHTQLGERLLDYWGANFFAKGITPTAIGLNAWEAILRNPNGICPVQTRLVAGVLWDDGMTGLLRCAKHYPRVTDGAQARREAARARSHLSVRSEQRRERLKKSKQREQRTAAKLRAAEAAKAVAAEQRARASLEPTYDRTGLVNVCGRPRKTKKPPLPPSPPAT